ncbi:MAG TPA: FAD-dependent monooxygenase [Candidatus Limnocylindrales bacterium]|nr:FAD-dependent monooxygenase [Candidatus Limnocylindrales bacterium]
MSVKPITIIGGGLAGLTLGIGLRQRGVPVMIYEAGHYPRHKVCGEFISGEGREVLKRVGALDALCGQTVEAATAMFVAGQRRGPVRAISPPALCLSRFVLDASLARYFQVLGGELLQNQRWRNRVDVGTVLANGRQPQSQENGWIWFGLKVHARNVSLAADLELHSLRQGYVGLCRLPEGVTNVCGIFRRRASGGQPSQDWRNLLRGPADSVLHERLRSAALDEESFCSVAGLGLSPRRATMRDQCCIGDALTMIAPVTGNGMSMALEAAELAIEPLALYSRGNESWSQAQASIAETCDRAFARRLTWARRLQKLLFMSATGDCLAVLMLRSEWLWRLFFTRTR